jgi:hypothetical protein
MLVVANEQAGRAEADLVAEVVDELGGNAAVEVIICYDEGDLETMLDRRGDRTVVLVDGDGSLHTLLKHL